MNYVVKVYLALLLGIFVMGNIFPAQAQEGREAAITRCMNVAVTQHPGDNEGNTRARTAAYKACMAAAGHTP